MRVTFTLRLLTPLLGDVPGPNQVAKFKRDRDTNAFVTDLSMWGWAWGVALAELGEDVYLRAVRMDRLITAPSVVPYERRWKDKSEQRMVRLHEAVRKGSVMTIGCSVVSPDPTEPPSVQTKRQPTEQELLAAIKRIGNTLGISPFGSSQGYGRFDIENMEIEGRQCQPPVGRECADNSTSSSGGEGASQDEDQEVGV